MALPNLPGSINLGKGCHCVIIHCLIVHSIDKKLSMCDPLGLIKEGLPMKHLITYFYQKRSITAMVLFLILLGTALLFASLQQPAVAQEAGVGSSCGSDQININPLIPTTNDIVQITPSGVWCDACVPQYQSHQIAGDVIRIDAVANPTGDACPLALIGWSFTTDVGPLPAGNYTVQLYIAEGPQGPSLLHKSASFTVQSINPVLRVAPADLQIPLNETSASEIQLEDGSNLYGVDLRLTFDPNINSGVPRARMILVGSLSRTPFS